MATPLKRKWMPSPNYSSRGGAGVRLIVLHTAEGALSIESLGNFFASSSSGVSSHVGIDDGDPIGEYVKRGNKAWTAANANPVAVQAELCGFASWSKGAWQNDHANMLDNAARWIAEEAAKYGLPIVKLSAGAAQGSGRGVCQHRDLGSWGGNHSDCGNGFPMDDVIAAAKAYASGQQPEDEMGYPNWFWEWARWYLTTSRDNDARPDGAPDKIPSWAWDGLEDVERIGKDYGTTSPERDWLGWREGGADPDDRPDAVPDKIPERWWTDNDQLQLR